METNRDNDSNETPAPPKLVAALRRSQSARVFVPRTADEAILRTARNHLAPAPPRRSSRLANWLGWSAFATACVVIGTTTYQVSQKMLASKRAQANFAQDINRDGRVDILDALQLAQQLQSGAKPDATFDFNGDGVVDRRDAETIAAQAVKLEKGGRS